MLRTDQMRERAKMLRACVMPGEIYHAAATSAMLANVTVALSRDGDEFTLAVSRRPNVLDAIDLGMVAEAFGVADGSEPTTRQKDGNLVTTWQWREALPVQVR